MLPYDLPPWRAVSFCFLAVAQGRHVAPDSRPAPWVSTIIAKGLIRTFDESSFGWYLLSDSHDEGYRCHSNPYVLIRPPGGLARSHQSRIELSYTWNPCSLRLL